MLPPGALVGATVGVSISNSPDLGRLGLEELHVELALGEVTRTVLVAGGKLAYGGHLDPDGYTVFLQSELEKYGRSDRPLIVCLAWQEHRERALTDLKRAERALGLLGRIEYLAPDGSVMDKADDRGEAPVSVEDSDVRAKALTGLRCRLTALCDARVLIGGRREGFQGVMPGVIEEALLAIEAGQPLFLAGGFGGATYDAAVTLGLGVDEWPPFGGDHRPEWLSNLESIATRVAWGSDSNGLTHEENQRLAATHRPSDVATLVAVGLGRLAQENGLETVG